MTVMKNNDVTMEDTVKSDTGKGRFAAKEYFKWPGVLHHSCIPRDNTVKIHCIAHR